MHADCVIIGAGPSALSLATILCKYGKSIIIVDRENEIGGCHRVMRVRYKDEALLTEHGPRVYSTIFQTFGSILKEMGYAFKDLYTEYYFEPNNEHSINAHEYWAFIVGLLSMAANTDYGKDMSMRQFLDKNRFSKELRQYVNRLCKFTDGASIDRYTVYEFLNLINQHPFYTFLQPKRPNDKGLLKVWRKHLEDRGVRFVLEHEWVGLHSSGDNRIGTAAIQNIHTKDIKDISGDVFVIAIPPEYISDVLARNQQDNIANAFGQIDQLKSYAESTSYNDYVSIQMHWKAYHKIRVKGDPETPWEIVFIPLSEYMDLADERYSKTLVSCAITSFDVKSPVTGKTANESTLDELKEETVRQVLECIPGLERPDVVTTSTNVFWNEDEGYWDDRDTAWVRIPNVRYMEQKSLIFKNLYNVGCQNGHQRYAFTAIESAVSNAVALAHKLEPRSKKDFAIYAPFTLIDALRIFVVIVLLVVLAIIHRLISRG